jgi:GNAT superfamily N-acetyltransferase
MRLHALKLFLIIFARIEKKYPMMSIHVTTVTGEDIKPFIKDLARLRIHIFRDFPYLYEGSREYEEKYLSAYLKSSDSIIVLVKDGDSVVGASSAMPMESETDEVKAPFINAGIPLSEVFYFGESLLMKEYRGRGFGHAFFDGREGRARSLKRFRYCAFCTVMRPDDHPLKPAGYIPLDVFWTKRGYTKRPELVSYFSWQDIDKESETEKPMVFWTKKL